MGRLDLRMEQLANYPALRPVWSPSLRFRCCAGVSAKDRHRSSSDYSQAQYTGCDCFHVRTRRVVSDGHLLLTAMV